VGDGNAEKQAGQGKQDHLFIHGRSFKDTEYVILVIAMLHLIAPRGGDYSHLFLLK